jgi:hypothetical protein
VPWADLSLNATNISSYFTMSLSLLGFVLFIRNKESNIIKKVYLILFLLSAISILYLGSRTGLVIIIMAFIGAYFVYIFYCPGQAGEKIKISFIIFILMVFIFYAIQMNILGIAEKINSSTLGMRFSKYYIFDDLRLIAWKESFLGIFDNPLGGKKVYIPLNYVHNLWLDVGFSSGIFPFFILLLFSFLSYKDLLRLIKNKKVPNEIKILLTGIYISLFANFFVEPILEGYFTLFSIFCFIAGMTNSYIRLSDSIMKKVVTSLDENTLVC